MTAAELLARDGLKVAVMKAAPPAPPATAAVS